MRAPLSVISVFLVITHLAQAQTTQQQGKVDLKAEEAAIRAVATTLPFSNDAIVWTAAYARPVMGEEGRKVAVPLQESRLPDRRNVQRTENIVRLEVAPSGDFAYVFSNFTLSYDIANTNKHVTLQGSALRAWKKVDGKWLVVASLSRHYDDESKKAIE